MTLQELEVLKAELTNKGLSSEQISTVIAIMEAKDNRIPTVQALPEDPFERMVRNLSNAPLVQTYVQGVLENQRIENQLINKENNDFRNFIKSIDRWQKVYNVIFLLVATFCIWFLNWQNVIKQESAQTLTIIVIGIGVTNAIPTLLKNIRKNEHEEE